MTKNNLQLLLRSSLIVRTCKRNHCQLSVKGDLEMTNDQARIDLAVAFRWAARLNLHEGVANSFCAPSRESSFAYSRVQVVYGVVQNRPQPNRSNFTGRF